MRKFGKSAALGFVSVALAVFGAATPAAASGSQTGTTAGVVDTADLKAGQVAIHKRGDGVQPPAELGNPSEWGVVKLEISGSASAFQPTGNTCKQVTHGTWCYGWQSAGLDGKKCYSNYIANVGHLTTVRVRNVDYSSGWVPKGQTSYANVTIGMAYTCYAYYNNS
ncbi:lactococcin 972 family bacteriocin [Streptomyces nojiriensis]|uniref:lactococcin 972 family bacteriocin n=1 Tax=Streptomyces nojiriensis TaxID=66374 RepID=UPI0036592287